ncbi:Homeobox protein CDX-1, partial [Lamellibrachia satsuma]
KDKYRIVYSEYQKVELEKEYMYSKYITIQRKAELSRAIALSERQVKIWFQNRR